MISVDLARRLHDAGLRWHPASGDRFVIDTPAFADDVFTLSDMTIEAHDHPTGTVLGFNGTTEWALDSVAADDSLWLPREDQLRLLLAGSFRSLSRDGDELEVTCVVDGTEHRFAAAEAEDAYALALLHYVDSSLRLDDAEPPLTLDEA
jgi:hypothetical protein